MNACSMPNASSSTFAIGATQFVVHDAFEITLCCAGSYVSSFTPSTTVTSSSLAGARDDRPSGRRPRGASAAFSRSVNRPVDSITISTPSSSHGSSAGSRSARTRSSSPSTVMRVARRPDLAVERPEHRVVLQQVRRASSASVMSLTATKSKSAPQLLRGAEEVPSDPPNPLMPIFTLMDVLPGVGDPSQPIACAASPEAFRGRGSSAAIEVAVIDRRPGGPCPGKSSPRSSATTTERCRPPVQPIATVR